MYRSVVPDAMSKDKSTTVRVRKQTRRELRALKPYDSVSYDDIIQEMVTTYKREKSSGDVSSNQIDEQHGQG